MLQILRGFPRRAIATTRVLEGSRAEYIEFPKSASGFKRDDTRVASIMLNRVRDPKGSGVVASGTFPETRYGKQHPRVGAIYGYKKTILITSRIRVCARARVKRKSIARACANNKNGK